MLNADLLALQTRLGHLFRQPELLQQAVTHRSHSNRHYERLEFLGDAVLGVVVSTWLYQRLEHHPEGDLSRIRASLVKENSLAGLAQRLDLGAVLRLGEGELRSGGQRKPSILADVLEAVVGAVYLDAGFEAAQAVVQKLFEGIDITPALSASSKDSKTALQEWLQARKMKLPQYRVLRTQGEAHRQVFEVLCEIQTGQSQVGSGTSRRAAEQMAASALLQQLQPTA